MNKKENLILEEIRSDLKKVLELLENPKKELKNEKESYPEKKYFKKEIKITNPNAPATEKQKEFLISKEYNGDVDKLTKLEASKLIEICLNKNKE